MDCMLAGAAIRHQAPKFCGEFFCEWPQNLESFFPQKFSTIRYADAWKEVYVTLHVS